MPMRTQSIPAMRPHTTKQAGFLTSLAVWGMCWAIRAKIFLPVLYAWVRLGWSLLLHGLAGTLPNVLAWYRFGVLIALTGILVKVLLLQRDAKHRSISMFRDGGGGVGLHLGPA